MAFTAYTLNSFEKAFGLSENYEIFTQDIKPIAPSAWLTETLEIGYKVAFFSEKSRSETIVMPILLETQRRNPNTIGIYSGALLDVDKQMNLNGECDFVLALGKQSIELKTPIFCLIEAKNNDIEQGIPQCLAQMMCARKLNEAAGQAPTDIYGCVTTGSEWQFLLLKDAEAIIDAKRYFVDRLENLLGALQWVIDRVVAGK